MPQHLLTASVAACCLAMAPVVQSEDIAAPTIAGFYAPASLVVSAAVSIADTFKGKVSYYGRELAGRKTSSGEPFDPSALTMAHKTLPFGTMVRVTNLQNNKSVIVRVNDRGPHTAHRVGDVSAGAARALRMLRSGVVEASLEVQGKAAIQLVK